MTRLRKDLVNMADMISEDPPGRYYHRHMEGGVLSHGPDDLRIRHPSMPQDLTDSLATTTLSPHVSAGGKRAYISVAILCFINLINYMDRYTVAGVLKDVQDYYGLDNSEGGLLQTAFIFSYMVTAPIFGYLGDRYNRKFIIACGVLFWSATTLLGSFIPSRYFWAFILLRALVGTGEASYSTIAPTIIADLFSDTWRTRMLAIFYFAIPVGSGLGYVVGSEVNSATGQWFWALRVTPVFGIISVVLTLLLLQEPPRGEAEGGAHLHHTNAIADIKDLAKNRTFTLTTFGFTCVTFAVGALGWWAPTYMTYAIHVSGGSGDKEKVSMIFGAITCAAGILGVMLGSGASQLYRRYNPAADPLVCAAGVLVSVPLLFVGCTLAHKYTMLAWVLIFFGEVALSTNWALVADILLYVVIPTRRSMAEAIQILTSHALGDACSPYIIGTISDAIMGKNPKTDELQYYSLQYATYVTFFVLVFGGLSFLAAAWFVVQDKTKCYRVTHDFGSLQESVPTDGQILPSPVQNQEDTLDWSCRDTQQLIT